MESSNKSPSQVGKFSLVALLALLVLVALWWVIERQTGRTFFPAPLRLPAFGGAVALSLLAGWLATRLGRKRGEDVVGEAAQQAPSLDPERLSRLTRAARMQELDPALAQTEAAQDAVAEPQANPEAIALARQRPIVFREAFPPARGSGLSYYGGVPTGPADFVWPRHGFVDGEHPLTFIMQWDCRELAAQDAAGLLPRDGVLYFFADLRWEDVDACRFIHLPGDSSTWQMVTPPADLPAIYGDQTAWMVGHCSRHVPAAQQGCPVLLPNWPFTPLAFELPLDPEEPGFWPERAAGELLVAVQNMLGDPPAGYNPTDPYQNGPRPFPGFPHDWAAVRIVCATVLDTLQSPTGRSLPDAIAKLDEAARAARVEEIKAEAVELYAFAASHPAKGKVPDDLSDQIWAWMAPLTGLYHSSQIATLAANTSLGLDSDAAGAIPPELLDRVWSQHALGLSYMREEYAHEYIKRSGDGVERGEAERRYKEEKAAGTLPMTREVHAPTPNHMFGPASYVQGDVEELIEDHLLLLEFSSNSGIGVELGDGVVQYLIRPADLQAGRFDAVKVVASAY